MRLKEIRLAGFKSFVDPTTIPLPGHRNTVVGPIGCGKSNIIDAVRWAMGERSAQQLRGDAMVDVIFKGSSSRQPTGMASVELLFDNEDARVGGEYAAFGEIAVRRELARDGQSTYYLNGSRCRRRDIAGVFLGTGFGPRSYSIIEQGMISELADAKPDELRAFLEEAAGVSKYRERRRETHNRLSHTREHLARIDDLRDELGRQLNRLQRQARNAERYRDLKEQERRKLAELCLLRLNAANEQLARCDEALVALDNQVETARAARLGVEGRVQSAQERHQEGVDALGEVQARYYRLGADIGRLEQAAQYAKRRSAGLTTDLKAIAHEEAGRQKQMAEDEAHLAELLAQIEAAAPALDEAASRQQGAADEVASLERDAREMQASWDTLAERIAANRSATEACRGRTQLAEQAVVSLQERARQLAEDSVGLAPATPHSLEPLGVEVAEAEAALDAVDAELAANAEAIAEVRATALAQEERLRVAVGSVQGLRGEQVGLEAMQREALADGSAGSAAAAVEAWLTEHDLAGALRLGAKLAIASGWEAALETVLGFDAAAIPVSDSGALAESLAQLPEGRITLTETAPNAAEPRSLPRLADLIEPVQDAPDILSGIFAADSLTEALAHRLSLAPGESVITRDGVWLGRGWVRLHRLAGDAPGGIIRRRAELAKLYEQVTEAESQAEATRSQLDGTRASLEAHRAERERLRQQQSDVRERRSRAEAERDMRLKQQQELADRAGRIASERAQTATRIEQEQARIQENRQHLERLEAESRTLATAREQAGASRNEMAERLEAARTAASDARDEHHRQQGAQQRLESSAQALRDAKDRLVQQALERSQRLSAIETEIADLAAEAPERDEQLKTLLGDRVAVERELADIREQTEATEASIRRLRSEQVEADGALEALRGHVETARVERGQVATQRDVAQERLDETGLDQGAVESEIPDDADEEGWNVAIGEVRGRIDRLGPINLAAIDERREAASRKEYYDRQHEDLSTAVATLERAIDNMDRETRNRFRATFDRVGELFESLFPRIFGGGEAHLAMTEGNLLEAGVILTARPPGKRNSSIHLLSGGEKSMTALALLFAIFQLNPSPVCLLDEVDAALDDANIAQFKGLIEEMSAGVQFVVVTHNKLSMEMADHMIGITMQEAGVSRVVSVDVAQAVELAASTQP
ncbi:MAG: chromosome segregation protein SMC [Gammaproteobacteria bacterium]|nr:chromosome segregation protein SMC [Gammaproteobacteria bacterium]